MLGMLSGELGSKIILTARREYLFDICYDLICIRTPRLEKGSNVVQLGAHFVKREETARHAGHAVSALKLSRF